MSYADPFKEDSRTATLEADPFSDPSRTSLTGSRSYQPEYVENDLEADSLHPKRNYDDTASLTTSHDDDVSAGPSASANLDQRERELQQREADLEARAAHIRRHGRNNFPPFYPLIYHDIHEEIPVESQQVVQHLFWLFLAWGGALVLNMVSCIALFASGSKNTGLKDMISSIVYLPILSVLAFLLWYRPVYNGFMKEHSLFYYVYFVFMGFHLVYSLYMFLGIPSTGCAGLLMTIDSASEGHIVATIFAALTTSIVAAQGLGNLWYYRQIWAHNRTKGHTFSQAKAELATHGARAYFTRGSQV